MPVGADAKATVVVTAEGADIVASLVLGRILRGRGPSVSERGTVACGTAGFGVGLLESGRGGLLCVGEGEGALVSDAEAVGYGGN